MKNMEIKLNVYNEGMETVKEVHTAKLVKIPFGLVRKLMRLFNVDSLENTTQILDVVSGSWEQVIEVIGRVFPDIKEEEWDYVDTGELTQALIGVLKYVFKEMKVIPAEKN